MSDWLNVRALQSIPKGAHCKIVSQRDLVLCGAESASYVASLDIPSGSLLAINEFGGDGLIPCVREIKFSRKTVSLVDALTVEMSEDEQRGVIDRLARDIKEKIDAQIMDIMLGRR